MKEKNKIHLLPDGSGCFKVSFPLPKDHWLYEEEKNIEYYPKKSIFDDNINKQELKKIIREKAKIAIKRSTDNGKILDFDPDAMVQNFILHLFGCGDNMVEEIKK